MKGFIRQWLNVRIWLVWLWDIVVALGSLAVAYSLRFNFDIPTHELDHMTIAIPIYLLIKASLFLFLRLPKAVIEITSVIDIARLVVAQGLAVLLMTGINFYSFWQADYFIMPFSVLAIDFFVSSLLLAGWRLVVRLYYHFRHHGYQAQSGDREPVAIYGVSQQARIVQQVISSEQDHNYKVVAFIDSSGINAGRTIDGIPVLTLRQALVSLFRNRKITHLIIVDRFTTTRERERVIDWATRYNIKLLKVPPPEKWLEGRLTPEQLKPFDVEDLLSRPSVITYSKEVYESFAGRRILITGAAGSIGSELTRQLVQLNPSNVILLDQAESPLFYLEQELLKEGHINFTTVIGDITDRVRIKEVFNKYKPEFVFHTAAYKHVYLMERNPYEAIRTNILGTYIVAKESMESGVSRFIYISTDKAVMPRSVMGASKRVGELLIQALNQESSTKFIITRFGNVLGSAGSVMHIFWKQIQEGGPITITHPDVSRYFMTIAEACQLVLESATMGTGGEVFIFDMGKPIKILHLARKMVKLAGMNSNDIQIIYTGLKEGEKLHEQLTDDNEQVINTHNPKILKVKSNVSLDSQDILTTVNWLIEQLFSETKESHEWKDLLFEVLKKYQIAVTYDPTTK